MRTLDTSLFTPTEAAVLTRLPLKAVNNAIDKKAVVSFPGERGGHFTRLLDLRAVLSLALERRLVNRFTPELRLEVFEAVVIDAPRDAISLDGGFLKIDMREPRRELAHSLRELRHVRQLVISDPDIMGGAPVFRGTRVPVHLIAELEAQGESGEDLLASYPRITPEMIRLAPVYAAAYPVRGRPRKQPWHDRQPTSRSRRTVVPIEAA